MRLRGPETGRIHLSIVRREPGTALRHRLFGAPFSVLCIRSWCELTRCD